MKLLKKEISNKDGEGMILILPEHAEDMWHVYNLITEEDQVVTSSSTGSTTSEKKRVMLTLKVEQVDFDPAEGLIRVKGRNIEENPYVKMGAYHTIDLEINRKIQLAKPCWDAVFLERLETAIDVSKSADLAAVVMHEGLAHVCLVSQYMTIYTQETSRMNKFYEAILQAIVRHIDFDVVKCCLLASPGFIKDDFFKYIFSQAAKRGEGEKELKALFEHKNKFVKCHSTSGHKHALNEVLGDSSVMAPMADTK
eukprot:GSMAST32.ASY1.ANO1.210.1 assembled CDS